MSTIPFYQKHGYKQFFENIYFFSLVLVAISLPLSHVGMSIAQFGFGIAVFGGLNYKEKWNRLTQNFSSLLWIGLFVLFLLGGFHSEDQIYFWRDIRMKMPIWVFAVAIGCMPKLSRIKFSAILHVFLIALYIHTFMGLYIALFQNRSGIEYRDLSPMVSHIRMGLFLVLGIIIQVNLIFKQNKDMHFFNKWVYVAGILIFTLWLFAIKSLTAIFILLLIAFIAGLWFALRMSNRKKALILQLVFWLPIAIFSAFIGYYTYSFFNRTAPVFSETPQYTKAGCKYEFQKNQEFYENGRYVYDKYCWPELATEWEKRSKVDYFADGMKVHYTLLRYLTSKGFPKDAEGMHLMSDQDILNVEKGIPNYVYSNLFGLQGRVYETLWELEVWFESGDAQGKSLATRFELWKSAIKVIVENPLAGVGTGDVRMAMQQAIYSNENPIRYDKSFGAHNQFLTTAVALGLYGVFWMLACIIWPLTLGVKKQPLLFFFTILVMGSMLNEDVFETQAAITFICFFFHLFNRHIQTKSP